MADATDTQVDLGEILRDIQREIDLLGDLVDPSDAMVTSGQSDAQKEELRALRPTTMGRIDAKFPLAE